MYKLKDLTPGLREITERLLILSRDSSISKKRFEKIASEIHGYGTIESRMARDVYIHERSYAFYNTEWLDCMAEILKGKRVLEVSSGRGLLAKLMLERGIDWIATDEQGEEWEDSWKGSFTDVAKLGAIQAINNVECDVVFGSWFPFDRNIDVKIAELTTELNIPFIFVGEPVSGCTGSLKLWHYSDGSYGTLEHPKWSIERVFYDKKNCQIAQWPGCSDVTYILTPYTLGPY